MKYSIEELKTKCRNAKYKTLKMCIKAGTGHVTSAFSCAEIVTALYYNIMNYDVNNTRWSDRDRFVMSKNHGSVITYPILADLGFIENEELDSFLMDGSTLGSHSKLSIPGVEFSGGSLGIGLGVAAGMAYSAKASEKEWMTYGLIGDGECYEGAIWESALFAAHNKLNNLIVFLDRNQMCVTDYTEKMLSFESMEDKWNAFNWETECIDGHNMNEIIASVEKHKKSNSDKPKCIICNTRKGKGIDFMENKLFMHGVAPKNEWAVKALEQIGGK